MFGAYIEMWARTLDFTGFSGVSDYWWAYLVNSLVTVGLVMLVNLEPKLNLISGIYALVSFVPILSLTIRRLRDGGHHWANIFWLFAPAIGEIVLIVMLCSKAKW